MATFIPYELALLLFVSSVLRCANGILETGEAEKYCYNDIGPFFEGFAPWSRRNQCYILGLLCGYVLHNTKGRKIHIPPVINLLLWQFFLLLFFAVIYGPHNTELNNGIDTVLQRYSMNCSYHLFPLPRF